MYQINHKRLYRFAVFVVYFCLTTLTLKLADVCLTTDVKVCQMSRNFIEVLSLAFKPFFFFWRVYRSCPKNIAPQFPPQGITEIGSCYFRWYAFEFPSFCLRIWKGSRHMTSLLQLFKMESTCDSCYKQRAVIEFLVAMKETVGNIHKRK